MNNDITKRTRLLRYSCNLFVMLCFVHLGFTQTINRQYIKEINISPGSTIDIKAPGDIPFQFDGKIKVNTTNGYALEPRSNEGVAAFTANILNIRTSSTNVLKQIVTVKIIPNSRYMKDAESLANALEAYIVHKGNTYEVDNNLNIEEIICKNGFFTGTKNIIKLKDGNGYNIRGIEISSEVMVPQDASLSVKSKYIDVSIDDHNGTIYLDSDNCDVELNDVSTLDGVFNSCSIGFNSIDTGAIVAFNSKIFGKTVNYLNLGVKEKNVEESLFDNPRKGSLSTYTIESVGTMKVIETTSDEFNLRSLGSLDVESSRFSNYNIENLNNSLAIKAQNGNISISNLAKDVDMVDIDNEVSTIELGVQQLENYELRFPELKFTEKSIPASVKNMSEGIFTFVKGNAKNQSLISISCINCKIDIKD